MKKQSRTQSPAGPLMVVTTPPRVAAPVAGAAMTSAQVTVNPQMPSMGHGSTEIPVVTEMGSGRYQAYPVTFQMPGTWEVTITATAGAETGTTKVSYDVR
jgi:nitrogen fixation protein FixH